MRGNEFFQLKAFATVAQLHGFSRAAEHLGMSSSSVSQMVRDLETRLGLQLLHRTTRSVSLTEAGTRLLTRLSPVFGELDAMLEEINELRDTPSGTVRILTPRIAFTTYLEPLLGRFAAAYPEIVLDITVDGAARNLIADGYDLGIRLGEFLADDVVAFKLGGRQRQFPAASPAYLARHGTPTHPRDLATHRCINWRQDGEVGLYRWEFEKDGEKLAVAVTGPLILNDRALMLQAAVDGVGITMWADYRLRPLIDSGRLVALLEDWSPSYPGFFAYYPKQRHMPLALRTVVDFLKEHVDGG